MAPQSTHTQQKRQPRYGTASSRKRHTTTTLLAQLAAQMADHAEGQNLDDIARGQRIRDRMDELHLTEPAVVRLMEDLAWKLPREHPLNPQTAADKKGQQIPIPPLSLRGLQTYRKGGGAWEPFRASTGADGPLANETALSLWDLSRPLDSRPSESQGACLFL